MREPLTVAVKDADDRLCWCPVAEMFQPLYGNSLLMRSDDPPAWVLLGEDALTYGTPGTEIDDADALQWLILNGHPMPDCLKKFAEKYRLRAKQ